MVINYLILVNKENKIPDNREEKIKLIETKNVFNETIRVEKRTLEKFNELMGNLLKDNVYIQLDSGHRSIKKQANIWNKFKKEYGIDYVKKYVAVPWYSEHHTALAVDICIKKDWILICENDDMIKEIKILKKIHENLADYGFILRYPKWKENITWYSYEPRHLRYIDNVDIAKKIYKNWETLEEYLNNIKK